MRVGWGYFLLGLLSIYSVRAIAIGERTPHDCSLWVDYFGLQERLFELRQKGHAVPPSLKREIAKIKKQLDEEEVEAVSDPGFEAYVEWSPDSEGGGDEESAAREAEEQDREVESQYFSFDQKLARLEETLELRGAKVNHAAIQAIYPRMLAHKAYSNYRYRFLMRNAGVAEATIQIFALSVWAHDVDYRNANLPDEESLRQVTEILAVPTEQMLELLNTADLNSPYPPRDKKLSRVLEILDYAAEELGLTSTQAFARMKLFHTNNRHASTETFGKLLFNFLGSNDDLFWVYDSDTLDRYIDRM